MQPIVDSFPTILLTEKVYIYGEDDGVVFYLLCYGLFSGESC